MLNEKKILVAVFLAVTAVVSGQYVFKKDDIIKDIQSPDLGIEDVSEVKLDKIDTFVGGVKNFTQELKKNIISLIEEYISRETPKK